MYEEWQTSNWIKHQLISHYYNCTTVGLTELQSNSGNFIIYPNPVHASFTIKTTAEYERLRIFDLWGRQILTLTGKQNHIDLPSLEKGIYFIQLLDKNNDVVQTEKLIKELAP